MHPYNTQTLFIDQPCNQQWNKMKDAEGGKFCSHCNKTVIDFTNMTDWEVLEFFKKDKGRICGRINVQEFVNSKLLGSSNFGMVRPVKYKRAESDNISFDDL